MKSSYDLGNSCKGENEEMKRLLRAPQVEIVSKRLDIKNDTNSDEDRLYRRKGGAIERSMKREKGALIHDGLAESHDRKEMMKGSSFKKYDKRAMKDDESDMKYDREEMKKDKSKKKLSRC